MPQALDTILCRRSIRKYTAQPVPDELVEQLLRAAMAAPSAANQQPWHFVVIRDRKTLDAVPKFHPYSAMLHEAQLAILVCGDTQVGEFAEFWVQDCSAATENLLIAAQALGLGAVWLAVYPREDLIAGVRRLVGLPDPIMPLALVAVGYPAEQKPPGDRYNPERIHHDRW